MNYELTRTEQPTPMWAVKRGRMHVYAQNLANSREKVVRQKRIRAIHCILNIDMGDMSMLLQHSFLEESSNSKIHVFSRNFVTSQMI